MTISAFTGQGLTCPSPTYHSGHGTCLLTPVTAWVDLEAQRPGAAKPACDTRGPVEQFRWTKKNIVIVVVGIAMGATAVICVGLMAVEVIKTNPKAPR